MYGLNVFALIVVIGILYFVFLLVKEDKHIQRKAIVIISLLMLLINGIKLLLEPSLIPVEFSTIAYYVVPVIMLLNVKFLEIWAVYSAVMAGLFYYITVMVTGGNTYELYSHANIYISLYCHGSLLFLGLLKLTTIKYNIRYSFILVVGNLLVLIWALYIRQEIVVTERIFIYELIDGVFVDQIISSNILIFKGIYYILLTFVIYKSSKMIYGVNRLLYNGKTHNNRKQEKIYDLQVY